MEVAKETMEMVDEFRGMFPTLTSPEGHTVTNMDMCVMYANPDGTEYHYSYKVYRGNEAFFVHVTGDELVVDGKFAGTVDNDLMSTHDHGLDYGDEIRFSMGEIIPFENWNKTVGFSIGEMHKLTLGYIMNEQNKS